VGAQSRFGFVQKYCFLEISTFKFYLSANLTIVNGDRGFRSKFDARQNQGIPSKNPTTVVQYHSVPRNAVKFDVGTDFDSGRVG